MIDKPKRCRHNHHWLFANPAGARLLWCYECGAVRNMSGPHEWGPWVRPVGPGGENPAMKAFKPKKVNT